MPSYAQSVEYRVVFQDKFERTSSSVYRAPSLKRLSEKVAKSSKSSEFFTRLRLSEERSAEIDELPSVSSNWNGYGSPAPTKASAEAAKAILQMLRSIALTPAKVAPSAEGGVAMLFHNTSSNRAVIETLNDGEAYILLYDLRGNNQTLDWNVSESERLWHLDALKKHLRS